MPFLNQITIQDLYSELISNYEMAFMNLYYLIIILQLLLQNNYLLSH